MECAVPTINESELDSQEGVPCTHCPDYEGAIWLCGEGYLCERCFANLAGIEEEDLFDEGKPLDDFVVPEEQKERVRANLTLVRGDDDGEV